MCDGTRTSQLSWFFAALAAWSLRLPTLGAFPKDVPPFAHMMAKEGFGDQFNGYVSSSDTVVVALKTGIWLKDEYFATWPLGQNGIQPSLDCRFYTV